jgi:cytochrome c oxidase subunit 2
MRRPSTRLIITFLISLTIGYAVSWVIMVGVLATEFRLYGLTNLSVVAFLIASLIIIVLDAPLKLRTFDWPQVEEKETPQSNNVRHLLNVTILIVVVTLALSAFFSNINLLPVQASEEAITIDWLFGLHIQVIAFLFALVSVFIIYSIVVFRRKPNETGDGMYVHGNTTLEVIWTVVPLAAVFLFSYLGAWTLGIVTGPKSDELVVEVTASQFSWRFDYPDLDISSIELNLPRNRPILFKITSTDVIHSFWVPEFRVKQDAVPGLVRPLRVTPTQVGQYKVRCAELCGTGHANMRAVVNVMTPADFESWVTGESAPLADLPPVERGAKLAELKGCVGCHSADGSQGVGPTWLGKFGSEETLDDGTTVVVDEDYLHNSIINPNAQIVAGFQPNLMPSIYGDTLSEEDINSLIEYIKSLSE